MTAPGGNEARGLGDETGCLLVECTRSLNDERGTHATLRVVEVPTLGGTAAGDVELATSCVRGWRVLRAVRCASRPCRTKVAHPRC